MLFKIIKFVVIFFFLFSFYDTSLIAQKSKPKLKSKKLKRMKPNQVRNFFSSRKERGFATWYGVEKDSTRTSNGGFFNILNFEATHPTYPIGSLILIKNLANGKSTIVQINNNERLVGNRIIDMSFAAAKALGFKKNKYQRVELQPIENDSTEPFDASKDNIDKYTYSRLEKESKTKPAIRIRDLEIENPEYFDTYFIEDEYFGGKEKPSKKKPKDEKLDRPIKIKKPELEITEDDILPIEEELEAFSKQKPQKYQKPPKEQNFDDGDSFEEEFIEPPPPIIKKQAPPPPPVINPYPKPSDPRFLYGIPIGYYIQVGAFKRKELALKYREELEKKWDRNVYIFIKYPFYKVLMGDFANYQQAEQFRKTLIRNGLETIKPDTFYK